jgi:hypothetical protein
MKTAIILSRLDEMSDDLLKQVIKLVREGNGATGIVFNSPATLKQVNAVFAYLDLPVDTRSQYVAKRIWP